MEESNVGVPLSNPPQPPNTHFSSYLSLTNEKSPLPSPICRPTTVYTLHCAHTVNTVQFTINRRSEHSEQWTVYRLQWTQWTVHIVQYKVYIEQWTDTVQSIHSEQCTVYSLQFVLNRHSAAVCWVHCIVLEYSVQCVSTVYSVWVQCTVCEYSVECVSTIALVQPQPKKGPAGSVALWPAGSCWSLTALWRVR